MTKRNEIVTECGYVVT